MAVDWHAPAIVDRVRRGALQGVTTAIGIVEAHAVLLITTGSKTGRVYRRRGVKHQASAPGEAPANETGRLVQSRRIQIDARALRALLVFADKKARHLEHGTLRMKPRPFARRALLEKRAQVVAAISNGVSRELRK